MIKKVCFVLIVLLALILGESASAEKARSISSAADSVYHAQHLTNHVDGGECYATGNYIKAYDKANSDSVLIGHLEQADGFVLLDVKNGWAQIEVSYSAPSSPDSWEGMSGWVHADYIDCLCSESTYRTMGIDNTSFSTRFYCTVNNLRVRDEPDGSQIIGHIEQADRFNVYAIENGWANIVVTHSANTSPDSWVGLSGWVSLDYLSAEQGPSVTGETHGSAFEKWGGYGEILEFFYQAIVERWDWQTIVDSGFMEPYDFPDDLEGYGFVLLDMDSDGVDELIILSDDYLRGGEENDLVAIYARIGGRPVKIIESWTRNRNYLRADGSVYNEGSDGVDYSINYILELKDDAVVVRDGVLSGDYQKNGEIQYGWFHVTDRADFTYADYDLISDETAERMIEQYKSEIVYDIDGFVSFAEYERNR